MGTYRTTELSPTHPLAAVPADLRREERFERLLLTPLSAEDVTALIEGLAGVPPAAAVADDRAEQGE